MIVHGKLSGFFFFFCLFFWFFFLEVVKRRGEWSADLRINLKPEYKTKILSRLERGNVLIVMSKLVQVDLTEPLVEGGKATWL